MRFLHLPVLQESSLLSSIIRTQTAWTFLYILSVRSYFTCSLTKPCYYLYYKKNMLIEIFIIRFTHSKLLLPVVELLGLDFSLGFQGSNNSLVFPSNLMGQAVQTTELKVTKESSLYATNKEVHTLHHCKIGDDLDTHQL